MVSLWKSKLRALSTARTSSIKCMKRRSLKLPKILSVCCSNPHLYASCLHCDHDRAKPPSKGLIKAKFTYLLHFFSFLDQTCQIDYDCWPNDIKFLFDPKCQIVTPQRLTSPKWVKCSFKFQSQTCIIWKSFRRGVKQRKLFLATTCKTWVMGLQRNLIASPGMLRYLKIQSFWYFFSVFAK